MEKGILSLNTKGELIIKSQGVREQPVSSDPAVFQRLRAVVYLLVDCSSSMCGEKIEQVKEGALDFAKTSVRKGYRVGLISFSDGAFLICELTVDVSSIARQIKRFFASGTTNLTDALRIASERLLRRQGYRVVVVATDGCPNDPILALQIAGKIKQDKIEILAISTNDADQDFLSKLVSRKDLNLKVERNEFKKGMDLMASKLPVQCLGYKK